jgi:addiction module RelE/StbE family toxin
MRQSRHREFKRQFKKLDRGVRDKLQERFRLLLIDEYSPLLNNHKLHHPWEGYSSINITGDWRLIYKRIATDSYYLRAVGTHHQLFGT